MEFFGDDEQSSADGDMAPNLLGSFIQELEETIADLEQKIIEIEHDPSNSNLINSVFRAFHNLKGSSTMVGLKILPELMHFSESVFDLVRSGKMAISEKIISLLLEVFNAMRDIREHLKKDGKEGKLRYFSILAQLETMAQSTEDSGPVAKLSEGGAKHPEEGEAKKNDDDEFIKISRSLVEQLMLVVGDFMLVESSFQFMKVRYSSDWNFMENCQQLGHFSNKLQNTVLRMRLSPIKPVFSSMHRVVRATAAELSKKIAFEVHGAETLVDRSILDVIGDPIMHMLRNAVDHGLEKPEGRVQSGKALEGQVTLSAFHKAGEVVIQVSDDGRGIDPVRIRAKAVEKGFISLEESAIMSDGDANQLIFLPGFSGAEVVTNVSGRGVGMDVVKKVVESLGGNIDLLSNPGSGTTITMRLPLSMAISECLEFKVGARNFAVPQICIEEVFSNESPLVRDNIQTINDGTRVLVLRETPIPILDLSELFDIDSKDHNLFHIIQVRHGTMRFALQVGEIVGPCNMVCQPLPSIFAADAPFSGLTRRGDGSLMFQVDVGRLALKLSAQNEGKSSTGAKIRGGTSITDSDLRRLQQKIAVFENYESFCIPVHGIKQIVSVPAVDIHAVDQQTFITLDGTTIPLVWIEETLLKRPRIERQQYSILIYQIEERTFGLPMDKFGGIIRMPVQYDNTLRTDCITGSTVIDEVTCLVIDLFGLTAKAFGKEIQMHEKAVVKIKRLALAEDDPFFREQLLTFLKARDLECIAFPDGLALKEYLMDPEHAKTIDAVISDVEMPRMDGLTLTRWIKGSDHTRHLPCLIITSLTNKEVIRLAMSAGATAFIPKMHHQQVMQELKRVESGLDKQDQNHRLLEIQQKENNRRIVTFNLGDSCFAMPMDVLKEVSHVSPSLPVPNFPEWINSITAFRGKMVPVINLCHLFGYHEEEKHVMRQQAIVDHQGSTFAFLFDSIGEVLLVSQLVSGEGLTKATTREAHIAQYISGIYQKDHKLISLIDPAALVKICQQKLPVTLREESAA